MGKFYITTTLPYVNADPHVGFALEIIRADCLARYHRLIGDEVLFNTGTDEHGQKIYQKALEKNKNPQEYVDEYAVKFSDLKNALNLSYTNFIRTTDNHHKEAAQQLWKMVDKNGYIYKAEYKTKYCVGCELEKTDSELVDGKCPYHPNKDLEIREEENYFFKFSEFGKKLLKLYEDRPDFVIPENRLTEIKNFVEKGLQDFSISRLKTKMPWGVEVPGNNDQVMYVWFDALTNYISTLGWPEDKKNFDKWWPGLQICGKDNLRQQAAMWQAMLMAADLPISQQILVNGFINAEGGVKMSKSLGNVIDPLEYVQNYGADALKYFLLAKISTFEDSDFTKKRFEEVYQSDLANGLGNLVARVAAMSINLEFKIHNSELKISQEVSKNIETYEFDKAIGFIWERIKKCDTLINEREVWKLEGGEKQDVLTTLIKEIRQIGVDLQPFLPQTSKIVLERFNGPKIIKGESLFPRLSK
jgi:methionyl-tRNA synthetase